MRGRRLAIAVVVGLCVVGCVVVVAGAASKPRVSPNIRVSVVLARTTIPVGATDSIVVVNHSGSWLGYGGCTGLSPRTGARFKLPPNTAFCLADFPIAPHSRYRLSVSSAYQDPIPGAQPGEYWVWVPLWASAHRRATNGPLHLAYTKLTVLDSAP
jgi:hypothetical protein